MWRRGYPRRRVSLSLYVRINPDNYGFAVKFSGSSLISIATRHNKRLARLIGRSPASGSVIVIVFVFSLISTFIFSVPFINIISEVFARFERFLHCRKIEPRPAHRMSKQICHTCRFYIYAAKAFVLFAVGFKMPPKCGFACR